MYKKFLSTLNYVVLLPVVLFGNVLNKLGFIGNAYAFYEFAFDNFKREHYLFFKTMLLRKLAQISYQYSDFEGAVYFYSIICEKAGNKELSKEDLTEFGWSLYEQDEFYRAIDCYEEAKLLAELANDKLTLADALNALGAINCALGDYETSIVNCEKAFEIYSSIAELNGYIKSIINIGASYLALARFEEAESCYLRILEKETEVSEELTLTIATAKGNLGELYRKTNEFGLALELHESALRVQQEIAGKKSIPVAITQGNIGNIYMSLGEYEKALEHTNISLDINLSLKHEDHSAVSNNYNNLGAICEELNDDKSAIKYYKKAVESALLVLGDRHSDIATTRNNLAAVLERSSKFEPALETINLALTSDLDNFGEDHPAVARDWPTLAGIYSSLGKFQQSIELYMKAIRSDIKSYGSVSEVLGQKYNNIAFTYYEMGNTQEAIKNYGNAYQIYQELFGEEHPGTKTISDNLSILIESEKVH